MTYPRKERRECKVEGCFRLLSNHFKNLRRCGSCVREGRQIVKKR